jgi:hypothetical protein
MISFHTARRDDVGGIHALVGHTAHMAQIANVAGSSDQKHMEFLPYPDKNFNDSIDEHYRRGERHVNGGITFVHMITCRFLQGTNSLLHMFSILMDERSCPMFPFMLNRSKPNELIRRSRSFFIRICEHVASIIVWHAYWTLS